MSSLNGIINQKLERSELYSQKKLTEQLYRCIPQFQERTKVGDNIKNSLTPLERRILEAVFQQEKKAGNLVIPKKYEIDYEKMSFFEFLECLHGDGRPEDSRRYGYLREIAEYLPEFRYGKRLFFVPHDFQKASFEGFELLCEGQKIAWTLLTHYGPNPPRGLYIYGKYGTGKTHLFSAFARGLLAELTDGYMRRLVDFVSGAIRENESIWKNKQKPIEDEFERMSNKTTSLTGEISKMVEKYARQRGIKVDSWWDWDGLEKLTKKDATLKKKITEYERLEKEEDVLRDKILFNNWDYDSLLRGVVDKHFKKAWRTYPYQPTDVAFATFDYLYDRRTDKSFVKKFLGKRIVIIDDIHPKGDKNRMEFIQRIIEHRYNEARKGATFLTSNLSPEQLLLNQDSPKEIAERVHSRLREMCMSIEFQTDDYRMRIAKKADADLLNLAKKLQNQ